MKAGLAAMMVAMKSIALSRINLRGSLFLSAVVDEEQAETGTKRMLESGIRSDFAVVGEPTGLKTVRASKGDVYYEITTSGKAAHSSTPSEGISAIVKMAKIVEAINGLSRRLEAKKHKLLGSPTLSVGMIEGGTATNVVPSLCKAMVDRRTLPGETAENGKKQLESLIANLRKKDRQLQAQVRTVMEAAPMEVPENSTIVKAARKATEHVLGHDTGVTGMPGATDAQLLYNMARIPSVILGPGDSSQAHKPNEHVSLSEVLEASRIYAWLALSLLL
jgi:acetylornithine deacetylase/succinyl-diaminopimelate desuccinylase-like protein